MNFELKKSNHISEQLLRIATLALIFTMYICTAVSQSFSINTDGTAAHPSALLEVKSTTKGLLLPRLTKAQKNAIAAPATGLLVYQTSPDSIGFHYFDGLVWIWLNPLNSEDWKITGNSNTDTAIHFFGTTNNMPIKFKQNNILAAYFSSNNNFIGRNAGRNFPGTENVAVGGFALYENKDGAGHVAIGYSALQNDTTITIPFLQGGPYANTAVGYAALRANKSGTANTFVGAQAGINIDFGNFNTAMGNRALSNANRVFLNNTSSFNSAFGFEALHRVNLADSNAAFGFRALSITETGNNNTGLGSLALQNNSSGNFNTGVGSESLSTNTTGSFHTAIGYRTDVLQNNLINSSAIGARARVDVSNAMVLGSVNGVNGASATVNVGIGVNAPLTRLHMSGALAVDDFTEPNIIANNGTITVANRTYIKVSANNTPVNRNTSLSNGLAPGQLLILEGTGATATNGIRLEDADANLNIASATFDVVPGSTITLIWNGTVWVELHRSINGN